MADRCWFTAELWRWEAARDSWFFLTLPEDASALVRERPRPPRGFGSVRVEVTVGSTTWRTSVFPDSGTGRYVLPLKKAVRKAEALEEGEPVDVGLSILERTALPWVALPDVRIRPVLPEEHAAVGRLLTAAYAPSGMAPDLSYWQALRDTAARAADAEVWVAELDGRVAGTVTWAGHGSGQREIARDGEAEFRMLGVDPAAQGRGVGQALLHAVVARARQDGYAAVVLCSATWMTTAHRIYERAGFHRIPERDWAPAPGVDLIAYRLAL